MTSRRGTQQQRDVLRQLRALAVEHPQQVVEVGSPWYDDLSTLVVPVSLGMGHIEHPGSVLELQETEDFLIGFSTIFPDSPPLVEVEHERWLGLVHTLAGARWSQRGIRLCTYLDSNREWHPNYGVKGSIERIWTFLDDAANGRFDPREALFHAIGGIQPHSSSSATAVVRREFGNLGKKLRIGSATVRSPARVDIVSRDNSALRTITISVPRPLIRGPGPTLQELLVRVADSGGATPVAVLGALQRAARHNGPAQPLFVTIAVSREAAGAGEGHHLVAAKIDQKYVASLVGGPTQQELPEQPVLLEWLRTDDQRTVTATRRDSKRPAGRLHGLRVEVWGCGALGSWIAEFLVRAGVAHITVSDPAVVGADLLVRQNYGEADVGFSKAERLVERLKAISDDIVARSCRDRVQSRISELLPDCDLVIDATVNESVGDALSRAARTDTGPLLASVSTDVATASLGLVAIAAPSISMGPAAIDDALHGTVLHDGELEAFHSFWRDPNPGEELVAMRGCSTPTFHGSAADAAGMAAAMVNIIAGHLHSRESGIHLLAMPYAETDGPRARFISYTPRQ